MAITRQSFQNIPSSHIIPDDMVPAAAFALSFEFIYFGYPATDTMVRDFPGKVIVHVYNPDDTLKYRIVFEQEYSLTIFGVTGLYFYTWYHIPTAEKITATKGEGPQSPPMSSLGQGTFGVDPAWGGGTTNGEVIVNSRFYSKLFTEPLEKGDKVEIEFHSVGPGYASKVTALQLATEPRSGGAGLFDGRCGQQFRVMTRDKLTRVLRSRRSESPLPETEVEWRPARGLDWGVVTDLTMRGLSMNRGWGDTLYVLGQSGSFVKLFASNDEGESWKQIMSVHNDVTPLASCLSADNSTFIIYGVDADKKPAFTILKHGAEGWVLNATGPVGGENLPTSGVDSLQRCAGGEMRLLATGANKEMLLFSTTDGRSYRREKVKLSN